MDSNSVIGLIKGEEFDFKWIIRDYSSIQKSPGKIFCSPVYMTNFKNNEFKWQLFIYTSANTHISVSIQYLSRITIKAQIACSILNNENTHINEQISKETTYSTNDVWHFSDLIGIRLINDPQSIFLRDDSLTITCCISVLQYIIPNDSLISPFKINPLNFNQLYKIPRFSDLMIYVGNNKKRHPFHLHKYIISTCSSVLKTMIETAPIEGNQSVVHLKTESHKIMKELFRFIYTGKYYNIDNKEQDLYIAAKKYNIENLAHDCEAELKINIDNSNALEFLLFADTENAPNVKNEAFIHIVTNMDHFLNSNFRDFIQEHHKLAYDIMRIQLKEIVKKRKKRNKSP